MAAHYPVKLEKDSNHTILVTFPGYPGATFGLNQKEALRRAVEALETILGCYMERQLDIPEPPPLKKNCLYVTLPPISQAKVEFYKAFQKSGIRKSLLARRLGWRVAQLDRLLDLSQDTKLEQIEEALAALNKQAHRPPS
jgi:antitoxin HicB